MTLINVKNSLLTVKLHRIICRLHYFRFERRFHIRKQWPLFTNIAVGTIDFRFDLEHSWIVMLYITGLFLMYFYYILFTEINYLKEMMSFICNKRWFFFPLLKSWEHVDISGIVNGSQHCFAYSCFRSRVLEIIFLLFFRHESCVLSCRVSSACTTLLRTL